MGIVVLVACLLVASHGRAADEQRARELFKEGVGQLQKGKFADALDSFQKAHGYWRNPKILLNIATTLRELDRLPEAAHAYERYLASDDADPDKVAEVEQALKGIDSKLGRLTIVVAIEGAGIEIDGRVVERVDGPATGESIPAALASGDEVFRWTVRLESGEHAVEVAKEGYEAFWEKVVLEAGSSQTLEVRLEEIKADPPKKPKPRTSEPVPEESEDLSHAGQVLLVTRADIDGKFRGAVGVIGAGYGLGSVVDVQVAGLVGRDKGVEPGASVHLGTGTFKPHAYVGVPVFFVDGASPGFHGALGVQFDPSKSIGGFVQVGFAAFANVPEQRESTAFVPSVGVQGRL